MKWTELGQQIEGTWRGKRDGEFGPLGVLDTIDGERVFPLHTVLFNEMEKRAEGDRIRITYDGEMPSSKRPGKNFKAFTVEVERDIEGGDADPEPGSHG